MSKLVKFSDPRLRVAAAKADLEDVETQGAIQVLKARMAFKRGSAVSGPAVGMPVRVLAIGEGDYTTVFLNPSLLAASDHYLSRAEQWVHTGNVRRNVMRARQISISGTGLHGKTFSADYSDALALKIQQQMDLLNSANPFHWVTRFHHMQLLDDNDKRRKIAERASAGLYELLNRDQTVPSTPNALNLLALEPTQEDAPGIEIDALDPLELRSSVHRDVLSLILGITAVGKVCFLSPSFVEMFLAAKLINPALTAHFPKEHMACNQPAIRTLGLEKFSGAFEGGASALADAPGTMDAVVLDARTDAQSEPLEGDDLRHISRALNGPKGAFVLSTKGSDAAWEKMLLAAFPYVYVQAVSEHQNHYVATKTAIHPARVQARLNELSSRLQLSGAQSILHFPLRLLTKGSA